MMNSVDRSEQLFSYDDVEPYMYVTYKGHPGYIMDKGDHVRPSMEAEHIVIEIYTDNEEGEREFLREVIMHEHLVDKYLEKQRTLWVDLSGKLNPVAEGDS